MNLGIRVLVSLLIVAAAVTASATQTPFNSTPFQIPGTIEAESYDRGGEGVAWHDTTPGNAFGAVYRTDDMDVGPITAGGYHIGALAAGEWAEYTVNIPSGGTFTVTWRYSSAYPGATSFRLLLDGVVILGSQTVNTTGDWQAYTTDSATVNLTAGSNRVLRIAFDSGAFNLDRLQFSVPTCTMPSFTLTPTGGNKVAGAVPFDAIATGSPAPTYQWFRNGSAVPAGDVVSPIPQKTVGSRYTLPNAEQWKDAGSTYYVKATNSCGTVTSPTVKIQRVLCGGPDNGIENINRILNPSLGLGDRCDWTANLTTSFPTNYPSDGSYNEPVIAAAMAFIKEPIRSGVWNMDDWWTTYLSGELGDRGTAWYYGGQELGSYNYQKYNITSVLAVHFHANRVGKTGIRALARRWLRATFALQALAAMPDRPQSLHAKGQTDVPSISYTGPYVAMAGDRSSWGFWVDMNRVIPFAMAVGLPTNAAGERPYHRGVRTAVQAWSGVYPFTATEQAELRNIVTQGVLPANFINNYLGPNLRTSMVYHFVAWPGVKATLMEDFDNPNTVPTLGVAYFTQPKFRSGYEAHFLYPWSGLWAAGDDHREAICHGWSRLDLVGDYMQAWHPDCWKGTRLVHPEQTVTIDGLPDARPNYHLVLSPTAPPSLR